MFPATAGPRRRHLLHLITPFVLLISGSGAHALPERLVLVPETVDGQIPLMIETTAPDAVAARIEDLGGRVEYVYRAIEGLAATVPAAAYDEILDDSRVRSVQRQRYVYRAVVPSERLGIEGSGIRVPRDADEYFASMDPSRFTARPVSRADRLRGDDGSEPRTYIGYEPITRAAEVWEAAEYGDGTVTAIIDTGVYDRHSMYEGNVIGGFSLVPREEEEAIDLDDDGHPDGRSFPWHSVHNNSHGTFVAGLIAGHVDLEFDADDTFVVAVNGHSPESVVFDGQGRATVRLFGIAPKTDLFAIKVFPYDGGGRSRRSRRGRDRSPDPDEARG